MSKSIPTLHWQSSWDVVHGESIPSKLRPLKNRINVVLTTNSNFVAEGAILASSLEEGIKSCMDQADKIWIIGGANLYKEAMQYYKCQIFLTEIDKEFEHRCSDRQRRRINHQHGEPIYIRSPTAVSPHSRMERFKTIWEPNSPDSLTDIVTRYCLRNPSTYSQLFEFDSKTNEERLLPDKPLTKHIAFKSVEELLMGKPKKDSFAPRVYRRLHPGIHLPAVICEKFFSIAQEEGIDVNDAFINVFADTESTPLRSVSINGSSITNNGLDMLLKHRLRDLEIQDCLDLNTRWIKDICQLKKLKHLDISRQMEYLQRSADFKNPYHVLKEISENLPELESLDISGTNLDDCDVCDGKIDSGCDIRGLESRVGNPLRFLGLYNTRMGACSRTNIPALEITGDANERQIIAAGRHYIDRQEMIYNVLNDLYHIFRFGTCNNLKEALDIIVLDVLFDYERLVRILLYIVSHRSNSPENMEESNFLERASIFLLNSLACQVDGQQKLLVGSLGAMERMLDIIRHRVDKEICDHVMEIAWSTLWNTFSTDRQELLRNMMGLLGNVAEVPSLRPQLMTREFVAEFSMLLDSNTDGIEVSYNAAGVLAHMASDGPSAWTIEDPSRVEVLSKMVVAIQRWNLHSSLNVHHTPQCQHWAMWALANLTFVDNKYWRYVLELAATVRDNVTRWKNGRSSSPIRNSHEDGGDDNDAID
ncbi:ZYG11 [Lepeophtheirus salmonis]|uniref:ZYG11 n=1 Tax=Lepeophtheirus salmonis TaxID=72036 RepID=A0A7R8CGI4_LEPSM|nr:ZYG11 [Lepeophtheirus salmonis]CAF2811187.1 ZYG11 [Lepeophtheirus salmonis]